MSIHHCFFFLILGCYSQSIFSSIGSEEKEILTDFYHATNGGSWGFNEKWLIAEDPCTWYGITCLENNQFEIDLAGNHLAGTLPDNFIKLSHLTSLKLGARMTFGHGPITNKVQLSENFGNLAELTYLDLSQNELKTLPLSFGNLKKLVHLDLWGNPSLSFSDNFGNLSKLAELNLSDNQLAVLPQSFGDLTELTKLNLSNNQLTILPQNFGDLTKLTELNLSNNQLTVLPQNFENLKKLSDLNLSKNRLSNLPDYFGHFSALTILILSNNQLTSLPQNFGNLKKLIILSLEFNRQLHALPDNFGELINLMSLDLNYTGLISLPESFGNLQNLMSLILSTDDNLPDFPFNKPDQKWLTELPKSFGNLKNLQFLRLSDNNLTHLPTNFTQLKNLNVLNLEDNPLNTLPPDFSHLTRLERLSLTANQLNELPQDFGKLSQLQILFITINPLKPLSKKALTFLPDSFGNLEKLERLTLKNIPLVELPKNFSNLKKLSGLTLTGSQLTHLPDDFGNLQQLTSLNLSHNRLIDLPENFITLSGLNRIDLSDNQLFFIPQNNAQMILTNNPIGQLQKDSDNFMNWAESLFYDLLSPGNQVSQVFSIKDLQSPYFGYWYFRYYPETGIYLGLKPNKENTHYNIYVSGGSFGQELIFIETLPNLIKNIPQFSLSSCVAEIPFPQQGTTIEYTYNKGLLIVFIKEFNENQSIIEEQLTLSGKTTKTITTQFFSISERGSPLRFLDKIIVETEDKTTTIEYLRPRIFELESYCKGEKYVISKVIQSSDSGTEVISIPSKILYINATNIQLILPSGTFNTIKKTISSQEEDIQIETWIDIDTGLVVVERGSTKAGVVLYTQVLK